MNISEKYPQGELLSQINSPADLRKLNLSQLEQVCSELRQYIIDIVSEKGGHFGASLGVVELTVALHYVFNTPNDQLVWDVGHQAYGHKILTGRKEQFSSNRIKGGLSGFPKRSESVYDTFGVGHASTSISAALGMAIASKSNGDNTKQHIAVIGDGSMTAGIAFEGLNHAGVENTNLLVILNDNCMSIDPAVGALKEYLADISTSKTYNRARNKIWKVLGKISQFGPNAQKIAKKVEGAVKTTLLGESNYFESLNFRYFGPIDGHDAKHVAEILNDLKNIPGPKILHDKIKIENRPIVFVTHMEHHSNQTSWIETIAEVIVIPHTKDGHVDLEQLKVLLEKYKDRDFKIAAVTSCSNVTGVFTPYYEIAEIMHENKGFCFVDFACSAPYIDIDMHPKNTKQKLDAIYFSPHKFLGGPGASGILVFNKDLYTNKVPDSPGGGTVDWTNPWGEHKYVNDIQKREDGGTPAFLQTIKTALVLQLKQQMGVKNILEREHELHKIVWQKFSQLKNTHVLASNFSGRLGVYSFYIDDLHFNLAVQLLND